MKIDIGNGKILGTKEVSSNGQISGFTEYAGREVLVVLPEDDTAVEPEAREVVEEVALATREHMKHVFDEYEQAKERFQGPGDATRRFLSENTPQTFQGLYDRVEHWVQDQVTEAEDRVKEAIDYEDHHGQSGQSHDPVDPNKSDDDRSRSTSATSQPTTEESP